MRRSADVVLRVLDEAIDVLVDGSQDVRPEMIRREESTRTEFIEDLLRVDADLSPLDERAQPFGLDPSRAHHVLLAERPASSPHALERADGPAERVVVGASATAW